jgi:hypothetical protein
LFSWPLTTLSLSLLLAPLSALLTLSLPLSARLSLLTTLRRPLLAFPLPGLILVAFLRLPVLLLA